MIGSCQSSSPVAQPAICQVIKPPRKHSRNFHIIDLETDCGSSEKIWRLLATRTTSLARLPLIANEDADGDGIENEVELLVGFNPGTPKISRRSRNWRVFRKSRLS